MKRSKNANIKASNKELDFETVSQGNRHRSNHTQNVIPSIVAGHQFLQFGHIGPKSGIFPITVVVTHPGFYLRTTLFSANVVFTRLPLQEFAVSLWHLLHAKFVLHFPEEMLLETIQAPHFHFSAKALDLAIISGKSNIIEVAGFTTASDIFRMSNRFSSEITEEHFSGPPPHVRVIPSFYYQ